MWEQFRNNTKFPECCAIWRWNHPTPRSLHTSKNSIVEGCGVLKPDISPYNTGLGNKTKPGTRHQHVTNQNTITATRGVQEAWRTYIHNIFITREREREEKKSIYEGRNIVVFLSGTIELNFLVDVAVPKRLKARSESRNIEASIKSPSPPSAS